MSSLADMWATEPRRPTCGVDQRPVGPRRRWPERARWMGPPGFL